jgi:CHAT domain-containing protein
MVKFREKQEMEIPRTCHLRFGLDQSSLDIQVFDSLTAHSKHITRGKNSIDKINDLSRMYRSLVVLRSFAEEEDRGIISFAQKLGEQLYALFFEGLEDFLDTSSNLVIEHSMFLLPLELAFDGKEFVGLKYSIGNWVQKLGSLQNKERQDISRSGSNAYIVLLLGDENEAVYRVFSSEANPLVKCDVLRKTRSDNLLRHLKKQSYAVVHLACHGYFDEADPDHSFLILDQDKAGRSESALLTCNQIKHTHLTNSPLVFLNACHSGEIKENSHGFVGFASVLLESGAANCITTLWSVSDLGASRFAVDFYARLLAGKPIGEALREARTRCWTERRDILTSLSYILFGDPTTSMKVS